MHVNRAMTCAVRTLLYSIKAFSIDLPLFTKNILLVKLEVLISYHRNIFEHVAGASACISLTSSNIPLLPPSITFSQKDYNATAY